MRTWIFIDWAVMRRNKPPRDPAAPTHRFGGQPYNADGIRPNADFALREAPLVVAEDNGSLPMGPDGYPIRAAARGLGTYCHKIVIHNGSTMKNDNGRLVHFTDGLVTLDDAEVIPEYELPGGILPAGWTGIGINMLALSNNKSDGGNRKVYGIRPAGDTVDQNGVAHEVVSEGKVILWYGKVTNRIDCVTDGPVRLDGVLVP
jgi:hypothetical protein